MANLFLLSLFIWTSAAVADVNSCTESDLTCQSIQASSLLQSRSKKMQMQNQLSAGSSAQAMQMYGSLELNPIEVEKRISTLVQNQITKGETISEVEKGLLEQVVDLLEDQIKPSIKETHKAELDQLAIRFDEMGKCNTDIEAAQDAALKGAKDLNDRQEVEYRKCQDILDKEEDEAKEACDDFKDYLSKIAAKGKAESPAIPTCKFPPPAETDLHEYLKVNALFFNMTAPIYVEKNEECKTQMGDHEDYKIRCAAEKHIKNTYFCDMCDEVGVGNQDYRICIRDATKEYKHTCDKMKGPSGTVEKHKLEWKAVEYSRCYIELLTDKNKTQGIHGEANFDRSDIDKTVNTDKEFLEGYNKCLAMEIDTSHLDFTCKPAPREIELKYRECTTHEVMAAQCPQMERAVTTDRLWWKAEDWKEYTAQPTSQPTPAPTPFPAPLPAADMFWYDLRAKRAYQSSTKVGDIYATCEPRSAIDGKGDQLEWSANSCTQTAGSERIPWWTVDLEGDYDIQAVNVSSCKDCGGRLSGFSVWVDDELCREKVEVADGSYALVRCQNNGRNVKITGKDDGNPMIICEVKIAMASPQDFKCVDTTPWDNGANKGCDVYTSAGWCAKGQVVPGYEWTMGAAYKYPERNCCECGKRQKELAREKIKQVKKETTDRLAANRGTNAEAPVYLGQGWVELSPYRDSVSQSSTPEETGRARNAVDGNPNTNFDAGSCTQTGAESNPWWQINLGSNNDAPLDALMVTNRGDSGGEDLSGFNVYVDNQLCAQKVEIEQGESKLVPCNAAGSMLRIELPKAATALALCEMKVRYAQPKVTTSKDWQREEQLNDLKEKFAAEDQAQEAQRRAGNEEEDNEEEEEMSEDELMEEISGGNLIDEEAPQGGKDIKMSVGPPVASALQIPGPMR